jgi:hypothetical protein
MVKVAKHTLKHSGSKAFRGNALPEYVVPLVTIVMASISVLPMGGQLHQSMQQALAATTGGTLAGSRLNITVGSTLSGSGVQPPAQPSQTVTITLSSGHVLTLGNYPDNPSALVETMGIAGASAFMMSSLDTLANQLKQSGSITDSQYSALIELSNRGHAIANTQAQLETLIKAGHSNLSDIGSQPLGLNGNTVDANGQPYTVEDSYNNIGSSFVRPENMSTMDSLVATVDPNDPGMWGSNTQFNHFLTAYKNALADGSLSDPVVKQVVDDLAMKILLSAESFETAVKDELDVTNTVSSNLTHQNSVGICSQGQGQDTGVACTP